jgi:hypothetical protein
MKLKGRPSVNKKIKILQAGADKIFREKHHTVLPVISGKDGPQGRGYSGYSFI